MKTISIESLSRELYNIDEKIIYQELLGVIKQIKKEKAKKYFLLGENQRAIFILDYEDVQFIRNGTNKLSFMDLAVHFDVDVKTMNWILSQLLEERIIEPQVLNYYTEVKNKPSVKAWFEPPEILTGEKTTLVIEVNSPCEIGEPELTVIETSSMELEEPRPEPLSIIKTGKLTERYKFKAKKHGTHRIDVTLGGFIEGVKFGPEKIATAQLKVKALPPELVVKVREEKIPAEYQQEFIVNLTISNTGTGEAQNLEIKGFEKIPEFEIMGPIRIGNIPAAGRIMYPISMKPKKSGRYAFEKLTLAYEDLDGQHFETTIPAFEVHVITPQPKVKVEIIAPDIVRSKQEFSALARVFNSGEGDAKNISFELPIDRQYILSGQFYCFIPKLEARGPPEEFPIKLQAPEKGELQIKNFSVQFQDIEGNSMVEKCQGKVIAIHEVEKLPVKEKIKWPFTVESYVGGQFYIIEELKEGHFAKVYRVKDTVGKDEVALKALKPEFIMEPGRVEEFVNEARHSKQLRHDNIVSVYEVRKEKYAGKEYPYIIMEYVNGGSLEDWLQPGKPMNFIECIHVMRDICLALMYAHQHGFIHCDIKPSNILYDKKERRWKLGDFGLAKIATKGEILSSGGTWWYMAPEAKERKVSIKSDIYSLGLVFREMLTGSINGDLAKIKWLQLRGKPLDSELTQKLIDLIQRMLSEAEKRPSISEIYGVIKWEETGV